MDGITEELQSIVRIGIVSNVNPEKMVATVKYIQPNIMSGELQLLQNCPRKIKWIPEPGDYVICLIIPCTDGDGVILGGI